MKTKEEELKEARNEDSITGEPGSHPIGVGVATAAAGAAGATLGSIGGPAGAAAGAVIGGVLGAAAGKAAAEEFDPSAEEEHWRENHSKTKYYRTDRNYDEDYAPAYRLGWEGPNRYGTDFETSQSALQTDWEERKGKSRLDWPSAKEAIREAWNKVEGKLPGDADKDGI
ncbi:hypothetical protein [Luteolibacter soli]|uniref:Glycine zipper domain-containing protein n=1 Tax=Luteolibacter soli TaxID=3135280 RepID=A0ABU9B053_9BACT